MPLLHIDIDPHPELIASVSLKRLIRMNDNQAPAGLTTLPANFTPDDTIAGRWWFAFIDATPAPLYYFITRITTTSGYGSDVAVPPKPPAPLEIDLSFPSGHLPVRVALTSLEGSSGGRPSGVPAQTDPPTPLNLPFLGGNAGVWAFPFDDDTPSTSYAYAYAATYADASTTTGSGTITPIVAATVAQTLASTVTRDARGAPLAGVVLQFRLYSPIGATSDEYDRSPFDATSGTDGILTVPLTRGAAYQMRRQGSPWWSVPFIASIEPTCVLPELLGDLG